MTLLSRWYRTVVENHNSVVISWRVTRTGLETHHKTVVL